MTTQEEILRLIRENGPITVPGLVTIIYPDLPEWEESSKRSAVFKRVRSLERYGLIRKSGTIGSAFLWEAVAC